MREVHTQFQKKILKEKDHLGDLDIDGRKTKMEFKQRGRRCGMDSAGSE
jgi:hypothetical protein